MDGGKEQGQDTQVEDQYGRHFLGDKGIDFESRRAAIEDRGENMAAVPGNTFSLIQSDWK